MSRCSVVMVSYYTGPILFASVKSVLRQKNLAELIVIDNGNPPSMLSRLQQMALTDPRLVVVTGGGNVGFAKGCNNGAAHATGDFLLLLNPGCLLPPDAIDNAMAAIEQYPGAMLAGAWLQNPDGSERIGGRRNALTLGTSLVEHLHLYRVNKQAKRVNLHNTPMPHGVHEVEAISGAFMCLRTNDYQALGGLDEGFFLQGDDYDLCLRIREAGGKIICVPNVPVTAMMARGEALSTSTEWRKTRDFMRYFTKHFRGKMHAGLLLLLKLIAVIRFGLKVTVGRAFYWEWPGQAVWHTVAEKRLMVLAFGLADLNERNDWYGKTVLVTGATGQVGLCTIKRLIASGAAVLALSRGEAVPFYHRHLRWLKGDLGDKDLNLDGYIVDVVVHCAPLELLPPVVDLLADAEVKRIVAFGSTSVFAKAMSKNPYERRLVDVLAKSELEIAMRCEARGMQWTLFRPTLIYGVGLDSNITVLAKFIDRFGFFPVYPPAFGRRQPVHADDLAIAVIQALSTSASVGKAYNLSGGKILTYHEMLEDIFTACQRPPRIVPSTIMPFLLDIIGFVKRSPSMNGEIARRMNDDLVFFHDDATRDFGYNPRPFLSSGMKDIEGF